MKSIHFMLDFYQVFKFVGQSHILELLVNPRHFPLRVTCFIYTEKDKLQLVTEFTFLEMTTD